jgi:hypothetical protein
MAGHCPVLDWDCVGSAAVQRIVLAALRCERVGRMARTAEGVDRRWIWGVWGESGAFLVLVLVLGVFFGGFSYICSKFVFQKFSKSEKPNFFFLKKKKKKNPQPPAAPTACR